MSPDKHTWYRVPAWGGDKRQWKRYLRDVELYLETERLDVDFSRGARLLSRLTGSARKYAETIELIKFVAQRVQTETLVRECPRLERAMGMEEATKKGPVQECLCKKLQGRPGQRMAELVHVFEKAVLDLKDEGFLSSLRTWAGTFWKEQLDPRATRACVGGS